MSMDVNFEEFLFDYSYRKTLIQKTMLQENFDTENYQVWWMKHCDDQLADSDWVKWLFSQSGLDHKNQSEDCFLQLSLTMTR